MSYYYMRPLALPDGNATDYRDPKYSGYEQRGLQDELEADGVHASDKD